MNSDPRLADQADARSRLAGAPTNPADNDFEGKCIQCLEQDARSLTLFKGRTPTACDAFCSFECAEMFAFELANHEEPGDVVVDPDCPHDVPDGKFCLKCRDEFLARARAKQIGGAA